MTTALQEVLCEDCGESLGFQAASVEVNREQWKHNRCPVLLAEQLGLPAEDYAAMVSVMVASLAAAYPEFAPIPDGTPPGVHTTGKVKDDRVAPKDWRVVRAEIAASTVLQALSAYGFGFTLNKENQPSF